MSTSKKKAWSFRGLKPRRIKKRFEASHCQPLRPSSLKKAALSWELEVASSSYWTKTNPSLSKKGSFAYVRLNGVGYRGRILNLKSTISKTLNNVIKVLSLQLGHSGETLIPVPTNISCWAPASSKDPVVLYGNSSKDVQDFGARIQSYRVPNVYKGTGVLFCDPNWSEPAGIAWIDQPFPQKAMKKK